MAKQTPANKPKPYYIPTSIQTLFVFPVIGVYLLQTGYMAVSTLTQFQSGSDYRPQLGYFAIYNLVPILMFLLAFTINPRKLSLLSKLFETLLITVAGFIVWSLLMMMLPMIFMDGLALRNMRLYEYKISALFIAVYAAALFIVRKRGSWS